MSTIDTTRVTAEVMPEAPVDRVNRAAGELTRAMDDWVAAIGDQPGDWKAIVWPASFSEFCVCFEHVAATRELVLPSPKLKAAIEAHQEAFRALESACPSIDEVAMKEKGKRVTKAAQAQWRRADRAEAAAMIEVFRFRCPNDASRHVKAAYLRKYLARNQAPSNALDLLLGSEMF